MKKYSLVMAIVLVIALAVPTFASSFTDVPANHWAYEAVNKLVTAGIINGYSDGTYKGQKGLTRYEIAVVVARALDNIADERELLVNDLEAAKAGLTTAQAQDVTAIVKALMEKNQTKKAEATEGLTEQQTKEVANLVEALTFEFKAELKVIGVNVDEFKRDYNVDMKEVKARLAALESKTPAVKFSGKYFVEINHQELDNDSEFKGIVDVDDYVLNKDNKITDEADDPYLYTDPWDDESDDFTVDEDKSIEQNIILNTDVARDNYKANIYVKVNEDGDENFQFDDIAARFENDAVKGAYAEENTTGFSDYAFGDVEFDGANVTLKNYGVDMIFGFVDDVDVETGKVFERSYYNENSKKHPESTKFEAEYYVFGAQKGFNLGNVDLKAIYGGTRSRYDEEDAKVVVKNKAALEENEVDVFGLEAATDLDGFGLNLDFAYSMPVLDDKSHDDDSYVKFAVAKGFDFGSLTFDYRYSGEDFMPLQDNGVIFDTGDDDYDVFEDGAAAGTKAWKIVVKPNILKDLGLETSFKYAAANEEDVKGKVAEYKGDSSDIFVSVEKKDLIPDLNLDGSFEVYDHDDAAESEKTFAINGDYALAQHIKLNSGYEMVKDASNFKDNEKNTWNFGVDFSEYPVFDALTVSAGINYEDISGDSVNDKDYGNKDKDEQTTEYNLGLAYQLGKAKLSYDFSEKKKDGDNVKETAVKGDYNGNYSITKGTYTINKLAMVYPLTDRTDFVANYKVLKLDDDVKDDMLYKVKEASAVISFDF